MATALSRIILDKFVIFGDSITEFSSLEPHGIFTPQLVNLYVRKLDVVCRGFGGYNTDMMRLLLPEIIKAENSGYGKIKLMTIFLGTNDAGDEFHDVPIERYEENLKFGIKLCIENGIKLILLTPSIHGKKQWGKFEQSGSKDTKRSNSMNKKYGDIIKKLGLKFNIPVVDLFTLFCENIDYSLIDKPYEEIDDNIPNSDLLLSDGIHFTPRGYNIMLKGIIDKIDSCYPEYSPSKMEKKTNHWYDIDKNKLEETLFRPTMRTSAPSS